MEFNATTRWLPDSSFATYLGKPAFHAYGKGNVNPTSVSQKMLTHNINGITGKQKSKFQQVYDSAYIAGVQKTKGVRFPHFPIKKENLPGNKKPTPAVARGSILPKTLQNQQKDTKKITSQKNVSIKIVKPRLTINGDFELNENDKELKKAVQSRPKQVRAISSYGKSQRSKSRGGQSSAQHDIADEDDFNVDDDEIDQHSRNLIEDDDDAGIGEGLQDGNYMDRNLVDMEGQPQMDEFHGDAHDQEYDPHAFCAGEQAEPD